MAESDGSSRFPAPARRYLMESTDTPRLARIATVGADGTPHVVPVGFYYDPVRDVITVRGRNNGESKKFKDIARSGKAAIVVDDLASVDPWRPRGVEVRGRAEAVLAAEEIRIHPDRVRHWGLEGPAGPEASEGQGESAAGA